MQAFFAGKTEIFFFFCAGCFPRRSSHVRAPSGPFSPPFGRLAALIHAARAMKAIPQAPHPSEKNTRNFSIFCNKPRVSASYK